MLKEIVLAAALSAALALGGCSGESTDPGTVDGDTDSDSDADTETSTDPDDDNDGDGLTNGEEEEFGTDPNLVDTDGDGASDYLEWVAGTDPHDASSNPSAEGDLVFRMPYSFDPQPALTVMAVTTGDTTSDLWTQLGDDGSDGEDTLPLMERVTPNAEGGIEDPLNPGVFCAGGLATADDDEDSFPDRFVDVPPGTTVCFDVVPARNETIPPAGAPVIYRAFLDVIDESETAVDNRNIYFYVPE